MSKTFLAEKNAHIRDKDISFEEGPHIYTINGDSEYISVTTFVKSHFSKFDPEKALDMVFKSKNREKKYGNATRDEIKNQWKKNGEDASAKGTYLHECIEYYYNGCLINNTSIEYKHFLDFAKKYEHLKPYRTEWMIYDTQLRFAGSIDMIFENEDGTLSIYDWKRIKELNKSNNWNQWALTPEIEHIPDSNFWHYSLQLNMYKAILEKNYNKTIKDMYLVCLHPNNENFQRVKVANLEKEIQSLLNLRIKCLK